MRRLGPVLGASLLAGSVTAAADVGPARLPSEHANLTFGAALAADGSRLAVGAPGANEVGFDAGEVYVYGRDGGEWVLRQRLLPDSGPYQYFGGALALDGDALLVSGEEPLATGGSVGVAHLFEIEDGEFVARGRWVLDEQASLGYLGLSVALEGDTLAFGGYLVQTTVATSGGRIRVLRRVGDAWVEEADLRAGADERLGQPLALDGDWLFAQTDRRERVAVYRRDAGGQWQAQADLELGEDIEAAVIVSDDGALVIGDRILPRLAFYGVGADGWQPEDMRSYTGDMHAGRYGDALAIGDGRVAYTSSRESDEPPFTHVDTIHLLRREGDAWVDDGEVERSHDGNRYEAFGARLALTGGSLLVGAPEYSDPDVERVGRVHVFARDGGDWTASQILTPDDVPGGDGCGCRGAVAPGWYALLLVWPRRRRSR